MNFDIETHILNLENKLLQQEIRKSCEEISKLLCEDFTEFCSSGVVYNYSKNDTFYKENISFEIVDFKCNILSEDCVLAKYKVKKIDKTKNEEVFSLRSSIWKLVDGDWKMFFHQGTNI